MSRVQLHHQSVLVKPVNTPITPLCTSLTTLTWEHVRNAGTFRDAISTFDNYAREHLVPKDAGPGDPPTFAFVTLTPWDLRVQLPREARDKNVVLPAYLQHPVLFGLRGEYQTFQSHHPETLAFSSSSLSSICAGLAVEEVRSSGKVTGGLPFHLQALAPSSPRRALEEALTLTRCLRSLIQKSRPSQNNPQGDMDVLHRPLDARSDVRAFLGERSKVLHLSGLPHDTTQSELESWFTQYGGRPIAFWTLRTPEGGKPSGSGFVVFGSHEEVSQYILLCTLIALRNRTVLRNPPPLPSTSPSLLLTSCSSPGPQPHSSYFTFHISHFCTTSSPSPSPHTNGQSHRAAAIPSCHHTTDRKSRVPDRAFADITFHQAAESLSMNGRALSDRAIEVSPSSSRVSTLSHALLSALTYP